MSLFESEQKAVPALAQACAYQDAILPKVSRTFALTIPQLPPELRVAVANAYLLCRIADTIEDEPVFGAEEKGRYEQGFVDAVTGNIDAARFAHEVASRLSDATLESERELMAELPVVLVVTASLNPVQRAAIVECIRIMSRGMHDFSRVVGLQGLETLREMDAYCYYVAGVVGEMLARLVIDFEPALAAQSKKLMHLAVSFGQGLQMTNILKDQWEDRSRGVCWLPQDVFARHGVQLKNLQAGKQNANYAAAMIELIGVAHSHLRNAIEYTLMIPARHAGYRRFCLWSIGLAVLTLRNLQEQLHDFSAGTQIKVSRKAVAQTTALSRLVDRSNLGVRWLFAAAARKLPLTPLAPEWNEPLVSVRQWRGTHAAHVDDKTHQHETDDAATP